MNGKKTNVLIFDDDLEAPGHDRHAGIVDKAIKQNFSIKALKALLKS